MKILTLSILCLLLISCSQKQVRVRCSIPKITYPEQVNKNNPETTLLIYSNNLLNDVSNMKKALELCNDGVGND